MIYLAFLYMTIKIAASAWLMWLAISAWGDKRYDKACAALLAMLVIK